jgi:hypothetical protein
MIKHGFVDLHDWYWIVGKDTNKVFSSAKAIYVSVESKDYVRWTERGHVATRIVSEEELIDAFAHAIPDVVPRIPRALLAYSAKKRLARETGGLAYNGKRIDTSRPAQALIAIAVSRAKPSKTIQWEFADGSVDTLDGAAIEALAAAVWQHVQALLAAQAELAAGISAGSITSIEQIDDVYAAIQ